MKTNTYRIRQLMFDVLFLTEQEYNALEKITRNTGMDTWFYIDILKTIDEGYLVNLIDLEGLITGVNPYAFLKDLYEGIVDYESCNLTSDEIIIFENILRGVGIHV